jgi:hypothetical protein
MIGGRTPVNRLRSTLNIALSVDTQSKSGRIPYSLPLPLPPALDPAPAPALTPIEDSEDSNDPPIEHVEPEA